VVVVSTSGGAGRWEVVVDGNETGQQGISGKYGMEVENVLESRESVEGDESALDGAGRQEWRMYLGARKHCTRQGGRIVGCMRIGRTRRALAGVLRDGLGCTKDGC